MPKVSFYDKLMAEFVKAINMKFLFDRLMTLMGKNKKVSNLIDECFISWINIFLEFNNKRLKDKYHDTTIYKTLDCDNTQSRKMQQEMMYLNSAFIKNAIDIIKDLNIANEFEEYSYKNERKDNTMYQLSDGLPARHTCSIQDKREISSSEELAEWKMNVKPLYALRDDERREIHSDSSYGCSLSGSLPINKESAGKDFSHEANLKRTEQQKHIKRPNEPLADFTEFDFSDYNNYNHLDDLLNNKTQQSLNSQPLYTGARGFSREDDRSVLKNVQKTIFRRNNLRQEAGLKTYYVHSAKRNADRDINETIQSHEITGEIRGYGANWPPIQQSSDIF